MSKSGKSLFANLLYNKLSTEFPMDKCLILNKDDMDRSPYTGAANVTFLRDIRAASAAREHSFLIIDDHNLTLDQIAAILMVVDNHPRTGVLLIDMGKPPGGVLFQRAGDKAIMNPQGQEYTYSLTKSKLPPSLPIYKVKAPSHFMWTPTIQDVAEKRMIYENLAYQIKEDAVADITNMIKTNPGGFSYHIFDNKTQRDSFFKDFIIDGFLKRSRFSYIDDMSEDNESRGNTLAWRHMWMNPFKKPRSWLEDPDYHEEAAKVNLPIVNQPKVKPPRETLPKVNLTSAFDAVAVDDAKKAEQDLEDAE